MAQQKTNWKKKDQKAQSDALTWACLPMDAIE
jgi:hypothetical protein